MGSLMEKELRKRQILLFEAGVGVILFAVWKALKRIPSELRTF